MVDMGAQVSIIDPTIAQRVGAKLIPCNTTVAPVVSTMNIEYKCFINIKIKGYFDTKEVVVKLNAPFYVHKIVDGIILGNNFLGTIKPTAYLFDEDPRLEIPVKMGKNVVVAKVPLTAPLYRNPKGRSIFTRSLPTSFNKKDVVAKATVVQQTLKPTVVNDQPLDDNAVELISDVAQVEPINNDMVDLNNNNNNNVNNNDNNNNNNNITDNNNISSTDNSLIQVDENPTDNNNDMEISDDLPFNKKEERFKDFIPLDINLDDEDEIEEPIPLSTSTPELEEHATTITQQYSDILVEELPLFDPPDRGIFNMTIKTMDNAKPFKQAYGRKSEDENNSLQVDIDKLFNAGIIVEAPPHTPYCSGIFYANKNTSKKRLVVDFRRLNSMTIDYVYPMARIDEILDKLGSSTIYSVIDCKSGFHQVKLNQDSQQYTTFAALGKLYMFTRACFGLKNAPAFFNHWLRSILSPLIKEGFVEVYVDDLVIFSKSIEEHITHVRSILDLLRQHKVFINIKKCRFFKTLIEYAGHIVSKDGIQPKADKTRAILSMPVPKTVRELRSFLGCVNFYRHFLANKGTQLARLTSLTATKNKKIQMTPLHVSDFEDIKQELCSDRCLMLPKFDRVFHVFTDASDYGSGLMIAQLDDDDRMRPVLFDSKKFDQAQRNYNTKDRETLAVVHAVTSYDYYLKDRPFVLHTDHKNLLYHGNLDVSSPRAIRMYEILSRFNYSVVHISGTDNTIADYLSRTPSFLDHFDYQLLNKIRESYESNTLSRDQKKWFNVMKNRRDVVERDGLFYWIESDNAIRLIVVDPDHINRLLEECHSSKYSGHIGITRLTLKISTLYIWFDQTATIQKFIKSCQLCQRSTIEKIKIGMLTPLPIPERPWMDLSMDFLSLPPALTGEDNLFVVVDRFSKMVKCHPCSKSITAEEAGKWFAHEIISQYGIPKTIVSDQDSKFTSDFWTSCMTSIGTTLAMTQPGRPQADGQTERMNRTILDHLRKWASEKNNWAEDIRILEACINSNINTSTKFSPNEIVYGFNPSLPWNATSLNFKHYKDCQDQYRQALKSNLLDSQVRQQIQHDKGRKTVGYQVGDIILVKRSSFDTHKSNNNNDDHKLRQRWCGPFTIISIISDSNVSIQTNKRKKKTRTLNIEDIKLFNGDDISDALLDIVDIIDDRVRTYGLGSRVEYLVKFDSISEDHNQWIDEKKLKQVCPAMVESYSKKTK